MIPSPANDPRVLRETLVIDSYDVIEIALSDADGVVAVLTYDRLAEQTPTVTLAAGRTTTTYQV